MNCDRIEIDQEDAITNQEASAVAPILEKRHECLACGGRSAFLNVVRSDPAHGSSETGDLIRDEYLEPPNL